MTAARVALLAALSAASAWAGCPETEADWLAFDGDAAPAVTLETKLPATTTAGPGPAGHRALVVTIPDLDRDEKACAVSLALPPAPAGTNAVRLWVRGGPRTRHLEVVLRTPGGAYATEIGIGPEWQQVTVDARAMVPWFSPGATGLDVSQATQLRLCVGTWQAGHGGGAHEFALGPVAAVASPLLAPPGPVATRPPPTGLRRPAQPFTVDLLDRRRGEWTFVEPLGSALTLAGPVPVCAFRGDATGEIRLGILCADPEFPDDPAHADFRVSSPAARAAGGLAFRLDEPYFAGGLWLEAGDGGVLRGEFRHLRLGPPTPGDRYVAAVYLLVGETPCPLWLCGNDAPAALDLRLQSDRVGHVFVDEEPTRVRLVGLCPGPGQTRRLRLEAREYGQNDPPVWSAEADLEFAGQAATEHEITVPLPPRYGIFALRVAGVDGEEANLRVCRVPAPRRVPAEQATVGMNLFQQQIWWYAYQVPLLAQAGIHWLRPWLAWENTWRQQQPRADSPWDTRALDAALRRLRAVDMRYEAILFAAPDWVAPAGRQGVPPADRMDAWADYVERFVRRYHDQIRDIEIWNEPDLMWPEDTRHDGRHYLAMLEASFTAARRADPTVSVHGLSHAGYEAWLDRVGELGAGRWFDVATIHTYAAPAEFAAQVGRRQALLERRGMGDKPLWINEFGTNGYDFNPGYVAAYNASEDRQAKVLVVNYAQALALGQKAFWFCSYDPRDPAHESQWTGDAGIGVLYLGFLPKLAYVALAGVTHQLDGRRCAGRVAVGPNLRHVTFEGPVSVVWWDGPGAPAALPATALGCPADEVLTLGDRFANPVTGGPAGSVTLDLADGPVYLEGSHQLLAVARLESAFRATPTTVAVAPGGTATVAIRPPAPGARLELVTDPGAPPGLKATLTGAQEAPAITLAADPGLARAAETVRVVARLEAGTAGLLAPFRSERRVAVTLGVPNLIRDPGFAPGAALEWTPERASPYALDETVGHRAPGSLRLDGPFDRRLVHWEIAPNVHRGVTFRAWVRTAGVTGSRGEVALALFSSSQWVRTWRLAATRDPAPTDGDPVADEATIPTGDRDWTCLEAHIPAGGIPPETAKAALLIDMAGGGTGRIWFDDVDLWQPEAP